MERSAKNIDVDEALLKLFSVQSAAFGIDRLILKQSEKKTVW